MSQEVEINVDSLPLISRVSSVGLVEGSLDGSIYIYKKKKNRLRTNIQVGNIRLYLQRCESFIGPEGSIDVFLSEVLKFSRN